MFVCRSVAGELILSGKVLCICFRTHTHTHTHLLWVSVCSATQNICMVARQSCSSQYRCLSRLGTHLSYVVGAWKVGLKLSAIKFSLFFKCYSTEHQALFSAVSACPIHSGMICIPQPLTTSRTPAARGQEGQVALPAARRLVKHLLRSGLVKIMILKKRAIKDAIPQ